jgi:hypothetical protein
MPERAEIERLNRALDNMRAEYMAKLNAAEAEIVALRAARDGTVAVEAVAAWVRRQAGPLGPYTLADALLAEFSRPVQPEPDALGGLPPSQPKEDQ